MILDTNALSAYLDKTPEAVELVSEAPELAIPVIVAGEFAFGIAPAARMMKVPPVGMPRGMISLWSGQVYSSRGGQFLGGAEALT